MRTDAAHDRRLAEGGHAGSAGTRMLREATMYQDFEYAGIHWRRGDRFRYRTWLALRLLNRKTARIYFQTTS